MLQEQLSSKSSFLAIYIRHEIAKLMWILSQTSDPHTIEQLFYTPVAHDLLRFE